MFLKRLEIVGFKSFAERVSVDFVPGVTAVVGPNGSGKSNITDAIRWVLGEQSVKSLRGAKMEDIIFGGSDTRKPLNIAEVTLTLDNEDQRLPLAYNEVSVTRRVYRSGDSDFFINKQSCRLKDIVDLFMDSGMGREAFSIISQGKVEEILSSKPEDRRGIFEEAAGVLKYKNRKKKAESKLAETQENLNRVEDIIHELSSQVEPLRLQASTAKDYLEKKEELEKVEAALIVYEIEELHGKWESLQEQLEQNKDRELRLGTKLQKDEAEIEGMREKMQALDESIESLQEVLLLTSKELEKLEGQRELLKERKKNAGASCEQLQQAITAAEAKLLRYGRDVSGERSALQELARHVRQLEKLLREKEQTHAAYEQNLEEQLDHLKAEYIEQLNKQAVRRNELHLLEEQAKQQSFKDQRLDEENGKFLELRTQLQQEKQELLQKQEQFLQEVAGQSALLQQSEEARSGALHQQSENETKLYQAYQYLQKARSRKEMLEEMQEDYTGFFQGVREVLRAKQRLAGIEGAVAELMSVPSAYETAVETALGAAMQHVVVQTEDHARAAIAFLKQHQYGRATFLPMSVIKGRSIPAEQLQGIAKHEAFIGTGAGLVQYDTRYTSIVTNLLGTVIVARDLRGANELARRLQYRYRVVTLDGDVVNPGGSMTGGAVKQAKTSLLGRQRELEEWTGRLAEMEEKTRQLEQYVKSLKDTIRGQEQQALSLRQSLDALRSQEQDIRGALAQTEAEERRINERLSIYDMEMSGSLAERSRSAERKTVLQRELEEVQRLLQQLDEEIAALTKKKSEQHSSKEQLQRDITDLKVQAAEQQQKLFNQKEKVARLEQEQEETKQLLEKTREDLALLQTEMSSNSSGETQMSGMIEKKAHDRNQTVELIASRREQRFELQALLENMERETKEAKRQHKYLLDVLKDQEVQTNRLDVELENRLTHLREVYTISYEAAKLKYPLELPADEARRKVKLIKLSIEELGTVNLGAIEEYERVAERHDFLQEQRTDLQEAKDTLHQVIGEMDEEMKKRFSYTLEAIRAEFRLVFTELFGGGRADLVMTDPQDLLNTGIDIVAQPPGKKLQNLGLLSGGERAFTAIALLFAILKVRPVPFCVLDEVEAALDDANVSRFAQYLKRFSSETQFIVITHRKGTMEECDVLYGVTMQESGVSKLVSVRLDHASAAVE
ncbi:chromosome segregation protein SMC [Ectobacillus ponti]|uniref:Chromosome partition protein Smc n=1 Tax=Ectobacillus ponti TaxID=2961894 RepID=A0AA42BS37_9BACI|nr:chromosome segregation protein SMC [Ectobacillus ponti]MCP8970164.1 chromosome segregation protein SMC [Ectobacillus ponti]